MTLGPAGWSAEGTGRRVPVAAAGRCSSRSWLVAMSWNAQKWTQVTLSSVAGLGAGQAFVGLVVDALEDRGSIGDAVGHLVGLPLAFAAFVVAMAAVLRPGRRTVVSWLLATAVGSTVAYLAGYAFAGPPVDFAASILLAGLILGVVGWRARSPSHRTFPTVRCGTDYSPPYLALWRAPSAVP